VTPLPCFPVVLRTAATYFDIVCRNEVVYFLKHHAFSMDQDANTNQIWDHLISCRSSSRLVEGAPLGRSPRLSGLIKRKHLIISGETS